MSIQPRPLGPRVLVKPLEAPETTSAGIVLPQEVRGRERRGMVIAVGDGFCDGFERDTGNMILRALPLQVGEVVVWDKDAGTALVLDNDETGHAEEFLILHYYELLVVLDEVPARVAAA